MKSKKVGEYEVRELTIGQMAPLIPQLADDSKSAEAQLKLLTLAVYQDGECMGESVLNLGTSMYTDLMTAVLEVNAIGSAGVDESGND